MQLDFLILVLEHCNLPVHRKQLFTDLVALLLGLLTVLLRFLDFPFELIPVGSDFRHPFVNHFIELSHQIKLVLTCLALALSVFLPPSNHNGSEGSNNSRCCTSYHLYCACHVPSTSNLNHCAHE